MPTLGEIIERNAHCLPARLALPCGQRRLTHAGEIATILDDVPPAVVAHLSDRMRYVIGQALPADGGTYTAM